MVLIRVPDIEISVTLLTDAMYLHGARQAYVWGKGQLPKIKRAENRLERLRENERKILQTNRDDPRRGYDKLEPIYIQMESAEFDLGKAYGPLLQAIATIHILCACSLEAHINACAEKRLTGRLYKQFEKFSLEAKWLFFPRVLGWEGFEPGEEPFQSFSHLINYRNNLVHYKPQKETWESPGVPDFLVKLGLTLEKADRSLTCVENMVTALAKQAKSAVPYWTKDDVSSTNYFDVDVKTSGGSLGS